MLKHKMSIWFQPGHDEELARAETLEEWFQQVHEKGYMMDKNPRVQLIHDRSNPVRGTKRNTSGFRVSVIGDIKPREVS